MIAVTIHLPDWIFSGPFWLGFGVCFVLFVIFIAWALTQMGPKF